MEHQRISCSTKMSRNATVFLSEIKNRLASNKRECVLEINLFEIEKQVGIPAINDADWRILLLEIASKPVNYLTKNPDKVRAWLTSWTVMPGKILCMPTDVFQDFTTDELLLLSAHSIYTAAVYRILEDGLKCKGLTNTDISIIQLRKVCDCKNKYAGFSQLKGKVIDVAISELRLIFQREIDYAYLKNGKEIQQIRFTITSREE